jgi:hypothetical protein
MFRVFGLLTMVVSLLAVSGCVGPGSRIRVGDLQTESRTVELGDAQSVNVEIDMGAGELDVSGGAVELLEAGFTYNVARLKPEVEYGEGTLSVRTPNVETGIGSLWDVDDYRYEWDLRLNDGVPMELSVSLGAGKATLELGSLSLTRLNVDMGAGEVVMDLTGDWRADLDVKLEGGAGGATLRLPRDVGVRVDVSGGLGQVNAPGFTKDGDSYVNDAYGESEVTLRIDVEIGLGAIDLELGE